MLAEERMETSVRVVRELTMRMRNKASLGDSDLVAICNLEEELSGDLRRRGRHDDARGLLRDALDLIENRGRREGESSHVDEVHGQTLFLLVSAATERAEFDEAIALMKRADTVANGMAHDRRRVGLFVSNNAARRQLAHALGRVGRRDEERRLLETSLRVLERLDKQNAEEPAIGLVAALSRLDLTTDDDAIAALRTAIRKLPGDERLPEGLEYRLATWIADDINPYASGPGSTFKFSSGIDPDAHADACIAALRSRCESLSVRPSIVPLTARVLSVIAGGLCAQQRASGRFEDAKLTASCLRAFGEKLVRAKPDEAWFHVILSEAFSQEAKNAWKRDDLAAVEAALRKALKEASIALKLDPRNETARIMVSFLQDKFIGLVAE
jgi:tetratricopeptide (TPR) repeat protein